jgi:hypothetical protein
MGLEAPPFGREPKGASDRFRPRLELEKGGRRFRNSHPENAGVSSIREDSAPTKLEGECGKPGERFPEPRRKALDVLGRHLPEEPEGQVKSLRPDPTRAPGERAKLAPQLRELPANLGAEVNGEKDPHQSIR